MSHWLVGLFWPEPLRLMQAPADASSGSRLISDSRILGQLTGLWSLYLENALHDFRILLVCVVSMYYSPRSARNRSEYHLSSRNIL